MVWDSINREQLSPMMQHYVSIKEQHPDCIIMYRVGDFYEMFFEDAEVASRELELSLTGKDAGLEERAPMAGVPHYVIDSYSAKMVAKGYKVAIVEQLEDPKEAVGLVKRAVTRIITPGTVTNAENLEGKKNNFLLALYPYQNEMGIAYTDISTGESCASEWKSLSSLEEAIADWIEMIHPSEILLIQPAGSPPLPFEESLPVFISHIDAPRLNLAEMEKKVDAYLGPKERAVLHHRFLATGAMTCLLDYIYLFQEEKLPHLNSIRWIDTGSYLGLNAASRENLELEYNLYDHKKHDSLLWVMDKTKTAMGSRLLVRWMEMPLRDLGEIQRRQSMVQTLLDNLPARMKLQEELAHVYDLERLLSKLSFGRGNARDLLALSTSLSPLPAIRQELTSLNNEELKSEGEAVDPMADLKELVDRAIVDEPPISLTEGKMIRKGFSKELDAIREGAERAKEEILRYEEEERKRTGINNLRIVYKKNIGYVIEVTKSQLDKVPEDYIRKQTLKNQERYVSDTLNHWAGMVTGSQQHIEEMEYQIFQQIRREIADQSVRIQLTAGRLAELDVLLSFAQLAADNHYCCPVFTEEDAIHIKGGRHPVVEQKAGADFIANDTDIGEKDNRIQIITGPNMAGKSTYMRQNALIIIMAQMGSFVPCDSCSLPITDQIFTRIGATDHLSRGESTFMVEMKEVADILQSASRKSFIILDEVGRGTSTNDGLAIAYAIVEYLSKKLKAKTLFATHYHELTSLAKKHNNISNRKVDISQENGELVFLRQIVPGEANKSYGVEVARLSGMPERVLDRADYILQNIDRINDLSFVQRAHQEHDRQQNFSDFAKDSFLQRLAALDINQMTPMEAMQRLASLSEEAGQLSIGGEKEEEE